MEADNLSEPDPDIQAQLILLAASHHNIDSLRTLLRTGNASVQDAETGCTPLHAAIAACEPSPRHAVNGESHGENVNGVADGNHNNAAGSDVEAAAKTVKLLLQNGAIWNDVDKNDETPGCLALRLGLKELYEIMTDAGVRAEMLLNRLDEYERLAGDEEEEADEDQGSDVERGNGETASLSNAQQRDHVDDGEDTPRVNNEDYLQSSLHFQDGRILDGPGNGVMMAWETDIMKRSADLLAPRSGLRILNIGHGMGIIDTFFQGKNPSSHHIIEAHTGVLERMRKDGWYDKQGVTIHEGRWQDVVPSIIERGILFDAIYFDTFAEEYKALRDFFSDCVLGLLDDGGRFGFFNGLGAGEHVSRFSSHLPTPLPFILVSATQSLVYISKTLIQQDRLTPKRIQTDRYATTSTAKSWKWTCSKQDSTRNGRL